MDVTFPLRQLTGRERSLAELTSPDERILRWQPPLTIEQLQAPYLKLDERIPPDTPEGLRDRIRTAEQLAVYGYFVYEFHTISMFWALVGVEMALRMKFAAKYPGLIRVTRKTADGKEEVCQISAEKLKHYRRQKPRWNFPPEVKDIDYSFHGLLVWAFREGLLPKDIAIPVPEIVNIFNNKFMLETFPELLARDGLLKSKPQSIAEIQACWDGLSEEERSRYRPKNADALIEGLPRFRNMLAHPQHYDLILVPRAPIGTYELLVDIVARLWAAPA
jgi:hypothetical protein